MFGRYYIIYPRADKDKLDVIQCYDYEKDEYSLASRLSYADEHEAITHAMELAKEFSKTYVGTLPNGDVYHEYLD